MTTSDLPKDFLDLTGELDPTGSAAGLPHTGMPDTNMLEQMANEFFHALPSTSTTVASLPALPVAPPATPSLPTEQQLRAMTVSGADLSTVPSVPGIAGGVSHTDFSSVPSFSFLKDARSLFQVVPTASIPSIPALPTQKIPYETVIRELPVTAVTPKLPNIPTAHSDLAAPQIPGAVARDLDPRVWFDFLEHARSINSLETSPVFRRYRPIFTSPQLRTFPRSLLT